MGEAFGADVTMINGKVCWLCADALFPHPASSKAVMIVIRQKDFIAKVFGLATV